MVSVPAVTMTRVSFGLVIFKAVSMAKSKAIVSCKATVAFNWFKRLNY